MTITVVPDEEVYVAEQDKAEHLVDRLVAISDEHDLDADSARADLYEALARCEAISVEHAGFDTDPEWVAAARQWHTDAAWIYGGLALAERGAQAAATEHAAMRPDLARAGEVLVTMAAHGVDARLMWALFGAAMWHDVASEAADGIARLAEEGYIA